VGEFDDLVERLAAIEEDLRDRAYDRLRDAAGTSDEDAQDAFKAAEKKLLQARRAIARAIAALSDRPADDFD
jgi:N-acetylmuramic acid 6-phosphate (MurNAc-6-P) etherase